ncbi:MAG: FHA domain-containing protein [Myxococcota bacterium]
MTASPSSMPCMLVAALPTGPGETYAIGRDAVVVGRSLEAALRIDSDGVSRFHARLGRSADGVLVVSDLNSSNGTFVNGRRIGSPYPLRNGDKVRFGPHSSFVVKYNPQRPSRDTVEVEVPPALQGQATDLLALRNQGRVQLAAGDYRAASVVLQRVVDSLDAVELAAPEDMGELLTDLARCRLELGDRDAAVRCLERATALLSNTSSAEKSLIRARFILAQAIHPERPSEANALVLGITAGLAVDDPLRRELEAWIALVDPKAP